MTNPFDDEILEFDESEQESPFPDGSNELFKNPYIEEEEEEEEEEIGVEEAKPVDEFIADPAWKALARVVREEFKTPRIDLEHALILPIALKEQRAEERLRQLLTPRVQTLLFAALSLAAGLVLGHWAAETPAVNPPAMYETEFRVRAPTAQGISVVGDFNDWNPSAHPMQRAAGEDHAWATTVRLPSGRYLYRYQTGPGKEMMDPMSAITVDMGPAGHASVYYVGVYASEPAPAPEPPEET